MLNESAYPSSMKVASRHEKLLMRRQRTTLAQYCSRPPRFGGTVIEALDGWKHWLGTPRKLSVARFTSLYSSVEEPAPA